jgi:hypothetical protein
MAQATVPTGCDKESVDKLSTFLAEPIFTRYQRQLPETFLQSINFHGHSVSFGISFLFWAGSESVFVSPATGNMMFECEHGGLPQ